jgi:hypothetical protein
MAIARVALHVVMFSGLASFGLAASDMLVDTCLMHLGVPSGQERMPSVSSSGSWVVLAPNSFCLGASQANKIVEFADGMTLSDCQDTALADGRCGDVIQSNAPHGYTFTDGWKVKCMCIEVGEDCSPATSSVAMNVYQHVAATPAPTTATEGTLVLYAASRYCHPDSSLTDLGAVSTVEECLSAALADSSCVDLIQTNAPHGFNSAEGWSISCKCSSSTLCPLGTDSIKPTSVFNNIYQYIETPTPSPTPQPAPGGGGSAQATGDPHLTNVLGQRFDLQREGWHTLVQIPQAAEPEAALLTVEAEARQMGAACADMYFQSLNLTGRWVGYQGRVFSVGRVAKNESQRWLRYGKVEMKVVQGHTKSGIEYLNFFVRHLKLAGYPVGGILGMDDHTAAASPSEKCRKRVSWLEEDWPTLSPEDASTAAADFD